MKLKLIVVGRNKNEHGNCPFSIPLSPQYKAGPAGPNCSLVNSETGEKLEGVRDIVLTLPLENALTATITVLLDGVEGISE
jgi:hypothetical protein